MSYINSQEKLRFAWSHLIINQIGLLAAEDGFDVE